MGTSLFLSLCVCSGCSSGCLDGRIAYARKQDRRHRFELGRTSPPSRTVPSPPVPPPADVAAPSRSDSPAHEPLTALVARVKRSVAIVLARQGPTQSQGTGFLVSPNLLATNNHVIRGSLVAKVVFAGGHATRGAVVASDPERDVALMRLDDVPTEAAPLELASGMPVQGERILVLGNPLGLEFTASDGIVAALRRVPPFGDVIQITAPISPGSSGSPVLAPDGRVLGIATFTVTDGQSLNFAVPAENLQRLATR